MKRELEELEARLRGEIERLRKDTERGRREASGSWAALDCANVREENADRLEALLSGTAA